MKRKKALYKICNEKYNQILKDDRKVKQRNTGNKQSYWKSIKRKMAIDTIVKIRANEIRLNASKTNEFISECQKNWLSPNLKY